MIRRNVSSLLRRYITISSYSPSQIPSTHPIPSPNTIRLNPSISSPIDDLGFTFSRSFSSGGSGAQPTALDYGKELDEINLKFAEAREEIDAAMDSKETVYFNEEAECARDAVKVVLDMFDGLLVRLPEKERTAVQRSMGLKMEQLKAELKQLEE